jgi:hypothetical protein
MRLRQLLELAGSHAIFIAFYLSFLHLSAGLAAEVVSPEPEPIIARIETYGLRSKY